MKTLYLECRMGAAGDMLLGALLHLLPDPAPFVAEMNAWPLPGVRVDAQSAESCGICGLRTTVCVNEQEEHSVDLNNAIHHAHNAKLLDVPLHDGQSPHGHGQPVRAGHTHAHHGAHPADIDRLIDKLPLSARARTDTRAVYALLAEAEAKVHGCAVADVHFSEVGRMDAIADIAGVCALMERLAPERVVASPVAVGGGQVHTHHGVLPVPAPATAELLRGIPTSGGPVQAELCTPTGAALLRHFTHNFGPQPAMTVQAVGYGLGSKEFAAANCVRAFLGHLEGGEGESEEVVELACNLDDMPGEELAFAQELLLEAGALDAYIVPIQMKKGRPGQMLCCLCRLEDEVSLTTLLLRHTSTFGVRSRRWSRTVLGRNIATRDTPFGPLRVKTGEGYGVSKRKYEYDDLARTARKAGLSIAELREALERE